MSLGSAIYGRLSSVSGVTSLVSTRIYPLVAPQNEANPLIVYQRIGESRLMAMSADAKLTSYPVQITSWADDYDGAEALATAVKNALHYWNGSSGSENVEAVFFTRSNAGYDDETKEFFVAQDYIVTIKEA